MMAAVSYFYSQDTAQNVQTGASDVAASNSVVEAPGINGFSENNTDWFNSSTESSVYTSNGERRSIVPTLIKVIVFLILVVAAIYAIMWFFKRKGKIAKSDDDYLRRVSTLPLGPGKSVEVVTLLDKGYLIGVTDGSINLLSEITDTELIQAMNLDFDKRQNVKKPQTFEDVLEKFMPNGPRSNKNIYSETEKKVDNISRFLK
ncbi:MAG: flagellar biosynthetic protein FliO [Treponema sp.]|nr:flagellar biosynthetic protein FliO [Treponema sp.]